MQIRNISTGSMIYESWKLSRRLWLRLNLARWKGWCKSLHACCNFCQEETLQTVFFIYLFSSCQQLAVKRVCFVRGASGFATFVLLPPLFSLISQRRWLWHSRRSISDFFLQCLDLVIFGCLFVSSADTSNPVELNIIWHFPLQLPRWRKLLTSIGLHSVDPPQQRVHTFTTSIQFLHSLSDILVTQAHGAHFRGRGGGNRTEDQNHYKATQYFQILPRDIQ